MKIARLGLIGDVHAEDENLEAALHFLRGANVQRILCTGDLVDGSGDIEKCCRLLQEFEVAVVRGNHDRWILCNQMRALPNANSLQELDNFSRDFLRALPTTQTIETVAGELLLCHGLGENDMQGITPDDFGYALECKDELQLLLRQNRFRFVVGGHTHRRMVRRFARLAVADFGQSMVSFHDIENGVVQAAGETLELPET